ncbi:hypothetical protein KR084_010354 [Drosophila pseudotakahashii]|nr:hypothetical protein KR084_010354 [Drosophila pseudotakahashii]
MEPKRRSSSYARRRRNVNVENDSSDSEAEMQVRAGLRVAANRSQSIPRKYISKNQFDRQVRSAVVEAFNDCMNDARRSRSVDEAGSRRRRHHRRSDRGEERPESEGGERGERGERGGRGERGEREDGERAAGQRNLTDRAKNNSVKKPALEVYHERPVVATKKNYQAEKPGTRFYQPEDGRLRTMLNMISSMIVKGMTNLIIFICTLIMNSRIVPAIEEYFARMPKCPLYVILLLGLFMAFLLAWAHEVGEPVARIREAWVVLFKKPTRSWWNFF